MQRRSLIVWLLAYLSFIVYGSLVPWDFRPLPLEQAWSRFQDIPYLKLGVASRADWIANGVLFLPLGFLLTRALAAWAAPLAWVVAVALCAMLAVGLEFVQLFFPPRTVSQNDLLAELIGSALGATLAIVLGRWLGRLLEAWDAGGHLLPQRLLEVYAVVYVALCFFPYDVLLSRQELAAKAGSSMWGLGLALQDRSLGLGFLQLAVEIALVLPIGLLLAGRWRVAPMAAACWGLLLGTLVEGGQFLIASGVSQGSSALARSVGVGLGAWFAPPLAREGIEGMREALRRYAALLLCGYLPLLLFAGGWFRGPWQGVDAAAATWSQVRLLPFYYHYYTSEAVALASLGSVALMFLPLAALAWARGWRARITPAAVVVAALVVETGKLFVAGQRPDPTNLIIAFAAAALALRLLGLADRPRAPASPGNQASHATPAGALAPTPGDGGTDDAGPTRQRPWPLLLFLPFAAAWAWAFPAFAPALLALLAACAAAVWWRPLWVLAIVPAALPALDLAPWSGRIFWTELDLLLGVGLAVAAFRTPSPRPASSPATGLAPAFLLLGLALAAATLRALLPWPGFDDNSFASFHSAYSALRIAKGAVWAALFVLVWRRLAAEGDARQATFGAGMVTGLAFTVAWVLWERVVFVGLLDFGADYRVTGPFSAMHRGGAYIECYLAVASAFALGLAMHARAAWVRAVALVVLAGAGYAVMVTYSRNGYAAYAAVLLLGLALQLASALRRRQGVATAATAAVVLLLVAAAALPVLGGSYARERLAQSARDLGVRQAHWADALQLRHDDAWTLAFGEGIGSFPAAHYWRSGEPRRAASYALARDGERRFLRLGPGAPLYIEQILPRAPAGPWTLTVELRSPRAQATVGVSLCLKSMLTSAACVHGTAMGVGEAGSWRPAVLRLDTAALRAALKLGSPTPKLSLATPAEAPAVDVGRVSLVDEHGAELVANGDFAAGMDRWFFSTGDHPPWHIDSLPVAVWFEQGLLGAAAWALAGLVAVAAGVRLWRQGRAAVPMALPALAAFLVSGSLNTLIDEPRFLWLLLVGLWLCALPAASARPAVAGAAAPGPPPGRAVAAAP